MSIHKEAEKIREEMKNEKPLKIAFFGQPGAGKSSLINKFLGKNLAEVDVRTDTTTESKDYVWGDMIITDLPGYGTSKFPKETYWENFSIRSYNIFLCIFEGKFKKEDTEFFRDLEKENRICLFVRNKNDQIWQDGQSYENLTQEIVKDVERQLEKSVNVFFTSCRDNFGISELQNAIYQNLDEANQDKWARNATAFSDDFLQKKRNACDKIVYVHAAMAAANAINPIPGADVAVDFGIIIELFFLIRRAYGLTDDKIKKSLHFPLLVSSANNILKFLSKNILTHRHKIHFQM